jgi:putative ABC transport system substrate-binding protein
MQRRSLVALSLLSTAGRAQTPPPPARIGFLDAGNAVANHAQIEALRRGLRAQGYVEGGNLTLLVHWTDADVALTERRAAELVAERVDLLVIGSGIAVRAAMAATRSIPIVMVGVTDPVGQGFVASLARPGGNATGLASMYADLTIKQIDLLREMQPRLSRLALLWNPNAVSSVRQAADARAALARLGIAPLDLPVTSLAALRSALAPGASLQADAMLIMGDPLAVAQSRLIAELLAPRRLPAVHAVRLFPAAGGLASYGPDLAAQFERAAAIAARILAGAKPAELPIEQPTRFSLVLNAATARGFGLTLPVALLASADEVIE